MRWKPVLLLPLLLSPIICPRQVLAMDIGITPARTEILLSPGQMQTGVITVTHPDGDPVKITLFTKDWEIKDGQASLVSAANSDPHSGKDWVKLELDSFVMRAGEKRTVRYTVRSPLAAKGTYWMAIVARAEPFAVSPPGGAGPKTAQFMVTKAVQLLDLIYLNVGHIPTARISIDDISLEPKGTDQLLFHVKVANPGIFGYRAAGLLKLLDPKTGKELMSKRLPPQMFLPQNKGILEVAVTIPAIPWTEVKAQIKLDTGRKQTVEAERLFQFN